MTDNWGLYNCIDVAVTHKVLKTIRPDCLAGGYDDTYDRTMQLYGPLLYMGTRGLAVDHDALRAEHSRVEDDLLSKQQELSDMAGGLNANSPKQCQQYFYVTLGHAPYYNKGKVTTDDKAMARLARKGVKEAKLVQDCRNLRKLKSTYLEVSTDDDGRVRAAWNPRGTTTGRLSSSQNLFNTGMNFQNLDPRFKCFIVPDEGNVFVELDKRQAEWIVTAYACGDPKMLKAIESGEDVHAVTGALISGLPIELVKREDKIIGHQSDPDEILRLRKQYIPEIFDLAKFLPRTMSCRQAGKKSNHGLNYMEGYKRFALENEMPETEAKPIVNGYRGGYNRLPLWWDYIEQQLADNKRVLTNCFGHRRRFFDEWGHNLKKQAVAFIPQSTVVNLLNSGMIAMFNDISDFMYKIDLGAQVHDSILFQYPIDQWKDLAVAILTSQHYLNPVMEYRGREFQIPTDMKVGLNWGECNDNNPGGMTALSIDSNINTLADSLAEWHGAAA